MKHTRVSGAFACLCMKRNPKRERKHKKSMRAVSNGRHRTCFNMLSFQCSANRPASMDFRGSILITNGCRCGIVCGRALSVAMGPLNRGICGRCKSFTGAKHSTKKRWRLIASRTFAHKVQIPYSSPCSAKVETLRNPS